jgi:CubicO group peptidase (beta-lactamase class C family)
MRRIFLLASAVAFLVAGFGSALAFTGPLLPKASSPEKVGLSSERLARIDRVIGKEIADKRLPGAVILIARKGKLAYTYVSGLQDPVKGTPMTGDSMFRIFSMTKPMVTVAALSLMEEGAIELTDPVSKFLPALKKMQVSVAQRDAATGAVTYKLVPADREITIHDLLRHTSGLTYGERTSNPLVREEYATHKLALAPFAITREQFVDGLSKSPLMAHPATTFEYGLSADLMGAVIEVVTGKRLATVLAERIWKPMKMTDTAFWVRPEKQNRLANAFATDPSDGSKTNLEGLDAPFNEPAFDSGGAGSLSTAGDYIRFSQMLLNGGTLEGVRILSRSSVQLMTADHMDPRITNPLAASEAGLGTLGYSFGLGFGVRTATGMTGIPGSVGEFMWAGAGGTYFWVDPKEQLVTVYMTQRPGPSRGYYRKLIKQLVHQAIAD